MLARYLDVEPESLTITATDRGKPWLAGPRSDLEFNIAHSQNLALLAFTRGRSVGIDVEWTRPIEDAVAIANRFFSPAENSALNAVDESARDEAFFNCWTRKEAFIKATGEGLQRPLDSFDVSVQPDEEPRLLRCVGIDIAQWSFRTLMPCANFIGAVAADGQPWALQCWTVAEGA
jgi:4'-phosphopantetheinyl transferase